MRRSVVVLACVLFTACGRPVVSRQPLFSDALGAPALREGVWLYQPEADCKVDTTLPTAKWPDCASWTLIAQDRIVGFDWRRHIPFLRSHSFKLAAGDPLILQEPNGMHPGLYGYRALKPLAFDPQGRMIGASSWEIYCERSSHGDPTVDTTAPMDIDGLRPGKDVRYARDAEVVRQVAQIVAADGPGQAFRWVRDGDH